MTKIGTEVAHVTCDSDTTFEVKRSKVNLHGGILWRPPAQLVVIISSAKGVMFSSVSVCLSINRITKSY